MLTGGGTKLITVLTLLFLIFYLKETNNYPKLIELVKKLDQYLDDTGISRFRFYCVHNTSSELNG